MNLIIKGNDYRFTVITNSLIRIEYDPLSKFEDRKTTTVINRDFSTPEAKVIKNHNHHIIEIDTDSFHLYYDGGKFTADSLYVDIKKAQELHVSRWYFNSDNAEGNNNLKGTARTLDRSNGPIPLANGIMSRDGYSYLDDSNSFVYEEKDNKFVTRRNNIIDGYLFIYGLDYQRELQDFYKLTGPTPLIPRFALGNWWSRYYPYTQNEYQKLIEKFDQKRIPISVSVLDMDWHRTDDVPAKYGSSWTGFSWNKKLFPDHQKLLQWLHKDGKSVTLNLHPADGIRAFEDQYPTVAKDMHLDPSTKEAASFDMENPAFRHAYFNDVLHPLEKEGVDFWWIDWQQGHAKVENKLDPLWLLNFYQYQDSKKEHANRALILSRYAGPGSHRYPLGFSGDTVISWKSLDFQPYFTSTAANIGYTWLSHDIGGHMRGSFDGELSTRWLQFGVFSPITRLHSSNNLFSGKEPWNFRLDYEQIQENFLRLRTKLVPYIDTANYLTHKKGIPLVKPVYYDYPKENEAYVVKNEYFFGSQMLVSPITQPQDDITQAGHTKVWLPKGEWIDYFNQLLYQGNTVLDVYRSISQIPVFVRKGSLIISNPNYMDSLNKLPHELMVEVFPGRNCDYELIENMKGHTAKTKFKWDEQSQNLTWTCEDSYNLLPKDRNIIVLVHKYKTQDPIKELRFRLQRAKIEFELKQSIYQAFISNNYSYAHFINLLNLLKDRNLRNSLAEIAYSREAYHE